MTTSPVDMRSTQMQMQDQMVQGQSRDLSNLVASGKGHKTDAQKDAKLRESCEGFESIFIQKMWQQMRETLPKTNMLQGKDEQYWQSMYDQELAKSMTSAGGIGLADMMYEQLSRDLVSASRTTASAAQQRSGGGFAATAAPLLQSSPQQTLDQQQTAHALTADKGAASGMGKTLSGKPLGQDMYSGVASQPEAADAGAVAAAAQPAASNASQASAQTPGQPSVPMAANDGETSPVVQQFLAELRQRQAQQNPTEDQPVPPAVSPAEQAAAQGITVAQHSVQQGPGGVSRSKRAQLDAANKPAGGGVMPTMQGQQPPRNARLTPPPVTAQPQQAAFVPPTAQNSGQNQEQNSAPNPQSLAAAVPQGTVTQAQAVMQSSAPVAAQAQALMTQATSPVAVPADQQPQVINTTFTTNIPGKNRRSQRQRGQRLPSGQPTIRTLPTPAPASPIATTSPQGPAGVQPVNAAQSPLQGVQPQPAVHGGAAPMPTPVATPAATPAGGPQAMNPQSMPQTLYQPAPNGIRRENS